MGRISYLQNQGQCSGGGTGVSTLPHFRVPSRRKPCCQVCRTVSCVDTSSSPMPLSPPSLSPITTPSFESLGPMIVVPSPSLENEPLHHPILRICRFRHLEKSSQPLLKGMCSLLVSNIRWSWRSGMRGSSAGWCNHS